MTIAENTLPTCHRWLYHGSCHRSETRSVAFKIFDAYGAASRPEATLRASGYVFLSKGILKRAGTEDATHAQLMYDDEEDRLGIKLYRKIDAEFEDAVREMSIEKSGASVNILPLIRYYDLADPKKLGKRILPVQFENGLVVIDLKPLREAKGSAAPQKEAAESEFDDDIPF